MLNIIAQTTTDLTTKVDFWTSVMEGASKWGLGIVLAILMFMVFFFMIRRTMTSIDKEREDHKEGVKAEREMFLKILDAKDVTMNSHLVHLSETVDGSSTKFEVCMDKIINSIDGNSKLFVEILNNCPLRKKEEVRKEGDVK